ncbi:hypothetical protein [Halobacteriovorax sp. JY17]|uniref:hypothetical protein n=1 Tax=Halobacteriovorax sp. JY17 TaxID=2014617 RepID=UPI000C3F69A8|nr:hypothetical protein [Halobacteriovorax sp. JY17]PIK13926.1 MAG: hypothetical protein CES88_13150 [Halobacteriovorax sp. JY17]
MEEVKYHLNLDYENFLSGSSKKIKGASWFDHIFFFINTNEKSILKTTYKFSEEYLEHLLSLNLLSNKVSYKGASIPWWGKCVDLEKEKFFNSKISMTELGIREGWIPIPSVITKNEAIKKLTYPMIARAEWGFSGRGVSVIRNLEDIEKISTTSVFSQFVEKYKDYGVTFNLNDKSFFIIENYIDQYGQFKGGELKSIDDSIGGENFKILEVIRDKLASLGAKDSIQIDTFTYKDGFHPFVEVNYRKTMGLMAHSLNRIFPEKFVYWGILKITISKNFKELLEVLSEFEERVVLLSPVDKFISVALLSDKPLDGRKVFQDLEKFISEF